MTNCLGVRSAIFPPPLPNFPFPSVYEWEGGLVRRRKMNMKTERRVTRPPLCVPLKAATDAYLKKTGPKQSRQKRKNIRTAKGVHPNYMTMKLQ